MIQNSWSHSQEVHGNSQRHFLKPGIWLRGCFPDATFFSVPFRFQIYLQGGKNVGRKGGKRMMFWKEQGWSSTSESMGFWLVFVGGPRRQLVVCMEHNFLELRFCRLHLLQEVQSVRVPGMLLKYGFIYISCIYIYTYTSIKQLYSFWRYDDCLHDESPLIHNYLSFRFCGLTNWHSFDGPPPCTSLVSWVFLSKKYLYSPNHQRQACFLNDSVVVSDGW